MLAVWVCAAGIAAAESDSQLVAAVKAGNRQAVRALLRQPDKVNQPAVDGTTALHWAVRADPNTALPEGETTVMTAARTGSVAALNVLLAHGANVNAREGWLGETALMWAAVENHPAALQLLIEAGADIDARSATSNFPRVSPPIENLITMTFPQGGWTSLMYAARQGSLSAVRVLADAGADLDVAAPDGSTALILAIINAHYDVAALLLEKGADPNLADTAGMGALYAAVDMRTLPWMQGRPAPTPSGRLDALDLIKLLLVRGANPNAPLTAPLLQRHHTAGDPTLAAGTTPLLRAAKYSDVPAMRLLLEHGGNPHCHAKEPHHRAHDCRGAGCRSSHR
jgi:ankyrin repeat protein